MAGVKHMQRFMSNDLLREHFRTINISTCWAIISGMVVDGEERWNM